VAATSLAEQFSLYWSHLHCVIALRDSRGTRFQQLETRPIHWQGSCTLNRVLNSPPQEDVMKKVQSLRGVLGITAGLIQ